MELAGIVPTATLPYPNEGGMYNEIFPPELINGIPFCQPTINFPNINVLVSPAGVKSNTVPLANLPEYFMVIFEHRFTTAFPVPACVIL